ncbi:cytoplasmic tRNA 2-thiolation protein 2 isoform X1 [Rissa tridactyla]|uniref:cytoplasmic tRNA 2-thiolation protein 2 isoform X1 n=1 Tax=Rissa tridactyla TaxID=75485 RepID=UPI0023BA9317|nr:cytoplasmic tRNA 2-thiolation protein 2 isoform X1 [Rissa tridactyla]
MCDATGDDGGCGADAAPARRRRLPADSHPRPCMKCGQGTAALVIRLGDAFCRCCWRCRGDRPPAPCSGRSRRGSAGRRPRSSASSPASSTLMVRVSPAARLLPVPCPTARSRRSVHLCRVRAGGCHLGCPPHPGGWGGCPLFTVTVAPALPPCLAEGAVRGLSAAQREQSLARMETLLQATGFPYHLAHLEQALELPASILQPGPEKSGKPSPSYKEAVEGFIQQQRQEGDGDGGTSLPDLGTQDAVGSPPTPRLPIAARTQELLRLFEAVETSTAREELLQMLRTHLILQTARTRGYTKVMTGESCTRVAIKLLTNLALGRGAFLAVDTGFVDNRHGDVMVVRPMREYMAKEIAFYNHFFDVPTVIAPPLPTKRQEKPSIHRLIERFLLGLQEDFPSTISTVYRTGEKLSPAPAKASSESQRCLLCLCALDIAGEEELALEPTLITEETEPAGDGCCQGATAAGAESRAAFIPLLCYGCRLTFKELGPLATLPPYVRAEAQRRIRRAQMEQQSQEVPLEDEEPGKS